MLQLIYIQPNSPTPIYQQLVEQIERLILAGKLKEGDMLPSVRSLASHLQINPMTISKAFGVLELKGWVKRERGRGMQVSAPPQAPTPSNRLEQLRPLLEQLHQQCEQLEISVQDALVWMTKEYTDE